MVQVYNFIKVGLNTVFVQGFFSHIYTFIISSRQNPFELLVVPDDQNQGQGDLFWDDGESVDTIANNVFCLLHFEYAQVCAKSCCISYNNIIVALCLHDSQFLTFYLWAYFTSKYRTSEKNGITQINKTFESKIFGYIVAELRIRNLHDMNNCIFISHFYYHLFMEMLILAADIFIKHVFTEYSEHVCHTEQ